MKTLTIYFTDQHRVQLDLEEEPAAKITSWFVSAKDSATIRLVVKESVVIYTQRLHITRIEETEA